jgi:transcriptional regulator with XRE-family HTH domain
MISERIKELRLSKKLQQKELAKEIGLSVSAICDIEASRRSTSIKHLVEFADYFGVSIDYLVGRTDNPNVNK